MNAEEKKSFIKVGFSHWVYAPNVEGAEALLRRELEADMATHKQWLVAACAETDIGSDVDTDTFDALEEACEGWEEPIVPNGSDTAVAQGWTEEELAVLYAEFIYEQGLVPELDAFLWRRARETR